MDKNTDRELADARAKEIILNINSKDVNGLKNLFSNKAIQESENIDEEYEKLFDFIGGEIISYESHIGTGTQDYYEYGEQTKELNANFTINTKKQKFILALKDYPIDSINSNNEGLYMILK